MGNNQYVGYVGVVAVALCACGEPASDHEAVERGALMFDLEEADIVKLHDEYLPTESLETTRAKFTAPFDCSYYGSFCDRIGRDRVIEITARQVDLALDGASMEELDAALDEWVAEADDEWLAEDAEADMQFRSSGSWSIDRDGNDRLKVRNGIDNPAFSSIRRAWTQSVAQERGGSWLPWHGANNYTQVCVNGGNNTQQLIGFSPGGTEYTDPPYETYNNPNQCTSSNHNFRTETNHARNNGGCFGIGAEQGYCHSHELTARGCGSAVVSNKSLSTCASAHVRTF